MRVFSLSSLLDLFILYVYLKLNHIRFFTVILQSIRCVIWTWIHAKLRPKLFLAIECWVVKRASFPDFSSTFFFLLSILSHSHLVRYPMASLFYLFFTLFQIFGLDPFRLSLLIDSILKINRHMQFNVDIFNFKTII